MVRCRGGVCGALPWWCLWCAAVVVFVVRCVVVFVVRCRGGVCAALPCWCLCCAAVLVFVLRCRGGVCGGGGIGDNLMNIYNLFSDTTSP